LPIEPIFDLEFAYAADVTGRATFIADGLHHGSLRLIHIPSQVHFAGRFVSG
jgi:hypothetical protein